MTRIFSVPKPEALSTRVVVSEHYFDVDVDRTRTDDCLLESVEKEILSWVNENKFKTKKERDCYQAAFSCYLITRVDWSKTEVIIHSSDTDNSYVAYLQLKVSVSPRFSQADFSAYLLSRSDLINSLEQAITSLQKGSILLPQDEPVLGPPKVEASDALERIRPQDEPVLGPPKVEASGPLERIQFSLQCGDKKLNPSISVVTTVKSLVRSEQVIINIVTRLVQKYLDLTHDAEGLPVKLILSCTDQIKDLEKITLSEIYQLLRDTQPAIQIAELTNSPSP